MPSFDMPKSQFRGIISPHSGVGENFVQNANSVRQSFSSASVAKRQWNSQTSGSSLGFHTKPTVHRTRTSASLIMPIESAATTPMQNRKGIDGLAERTINKVTTFRKTVSKDVFGKFLFTDDVQSATTPLREKIQETRRDFARLRSSLSANDVEVLSMFAAPQENMPGATSSNGGATIGR